MVLTHARQNQVTKIAVKQLLLWSHKTQCKQDQGVKIIAKLSPLVLTHARQSQVTKNCRKTSSALEPQNIVETRPGRENYSEIKPPGSNTRSTESGNKNWPQNNFLYRTKPVDFAKNNNESISQTIAET